MYPLQQKQKKNIFRCLFQYYRIIKINEFRITLKIAMNIEQTRKLIQHKIKWMKENNKLND